VFDAERDLQIAEAMAGDLKPYLLSETLYWSLGRSGTSRRPLPKGTLGGLLLRLHRLEALDNALTPDQSHRLRQVRWETDSALDRWFAQAEAKTLREIKARLRLWSEYLGECEDNPYTYQAEYHTQVANRTIAALLVDFAGDAIAGQSITSRITVLDQLLRGITTEGNFVWDEALEPVYPRERFWWLYVRLKPKDDAQDTP
jgi:hypothetical protein